MPVFQCSVASGGVSQTVDWGVENKHSTKLLPVQVPVFQCSVASGGVSQTVDWGVENKQPTKLLPVQVKIVSHRHVSVLRWVPQEPERTL